MRLKQRAEFVAVAKGRRVNLPALTIQALRRRSDAVPSGDRFETVIKGPRFGLTVTNKTGNSPERNRMRRRLREDLRLGDLPYQDTYDYVIVARRAILSLPFAELGAEVSRALRRVHEPRKSENSGAGQRASTPRPSGTSFSSDPTG